MQSCQWSAEPRKIMRRFLNLSLFRRSMDETLLYFMCPINFNWIPTMCCATVQIWRAYKMTIIEAINLKYRKMCCENLKHQHITKKKFRCTIFLFVLYMMFENKCISSNSFCLSPLIHVHNSYLYFWREIKQHFLNEACLSCSTQS